MSKDKRFDMVYIIKSYIDQSSEHSELSNHFFMYSSFSIFFVCLSLCVCLSLLSTLSVPVSAGLCVCPNLCLLCLSLFLPATVSSHVLNSSYLFKLMQIWSVHCNIFQVLNGSSLFGLTQCVD